MCSNLTSKVLVSRPGHAPTIVPQHNCSLVNETRAYPQHRLNFLPLPQGHGSLRRRPFTLAKESSSTAALIHVAEDILEDARQEIKDLQKELEDERAKSEETADLREKHEANEKVIEEMKGELKRADNAIKSIDERFEVSEKRKEQSERRYREIAEDYEKLADEKEILQKKFEKLSDEKANTTEVLNSVQKDNTKLKEEVVCLSAPKFATPK